MKRKTSSRRKLGITLIEALVAATIVGASTAAMVSGWYFAYNMALKADDTGVAYGITRQYLEQVKEQGFYNVSEAPSSSPVVHYYDRAETNEDATPSAAHFKLTATIVSDKTTGSNPVTPADDAIRTVTVTVTRTTDNTTLYQTTTYLARAGI